jgi:hypothetical protein
MLSFVSGVDRWGVVIPQSVEKLSVDELARWWPDRSRKAIVTFESESQVLEIEDWPP